MVFEDAKQAKYVRYAVPSGAPVGDINKDSVYCCNIAEIELYGFAHQEETTEPPTETEPTTEPTTEPAPVPGADDQNGTAEVLDIVTLQKFLLAESTLPDAAAADLDGDGNVDIFDLARLKRLILT